MDIHIKDDYITVTEKGIERTYNIGSPEAFKVLSSLWIRAGWDTKHVYTFTWLGRPIIQLPEDLLRVQEAIYQIKPSIIIETGVAHGGSLTFYASLLKSIGRGRVVGVDLEIRHHNRKALENHELFHLITLIEGSSSDPTIVAQIKATIQPQDTVFIVLDSNHSYEHVLEELRSYAPMVSVGSYIIATDGIMQDLAGAPRSQPDWITNNPQKAEETYFKENEAFAVSCPACMFNESSITERVTYWPNGWLKRLK